MEDATTETSADQEIQGIHATTSADTPRLIDPEVTKATMEATITDLEGPALPEHKAQAHMAPAQAQTGPA